MEKKTTQKRKPNQKKEWVMPQWMERYRHLITSTGGNTIEELMNNHDATIHSNAPLALICVAVKSQVTLLELLKNNNSIH